MNPLWTSFKESFSRKKSDKPMVQALRYFIAGGIATVGDYLCYLLWIYFFPQQIFAGICFGFTFGVIINYFISIHWAFSNRSVNSKWVEWSVFVLTGLIGVAINYYVVVFITSQNWLEAELARIPAIGLAFFWNFFSKKILLFRD